MIPERKRERWSARPSEAAASFAISAAWHFMILAVLALAVHPLAPPREPPPINLELLPPFNPPKPIEIKPPPIPRVEVKPKARPLEALRRLIEIKPQPKPVPPKLVQEIKPAPEPVTPEPVPPKPLETARPTPPVLRALPEVERPPAPAPPKLTAEAPRVPTPLPPAPLETARPAPALPRPVEIERPAAPSRTITADRPAPPPLPAPAQAEAESAPSASAQPSAALPVLTNEQVIQAPVEIKPPARPPGGALSTEGGVPPPGSLPPAGGGEPPPGGAQGGGGVLNGRITGFDNLAGGLRMRLGCLNPETYHLTAEERTACLMRVGDEARGAGAMGPNIPADKQADYDRAAACHAATIAPGTPRSTQESETTGKILGLGDNPRLRDCGPGDR